MIDDVLISIIVPVYNSCKFLNRCIDSILKQTFTKFELILVDDGSTDESGILCDKYAEIDSRIHVLHKENEGVSLARNKGLDKAVGRWVCFVDSDDWIEEDYLQRFINSSSESNLVVSSFIYESESKCVIEQLENAHILVSYENLNRILMNGAFLVPFGKLLDRNIIETNRIRFNPRIHSGEDSLFVFTYLSYIEKITTISNVTYHYCITGGGLSTKMLSICEYKYLLDCFYKVLTKLEKHVPKYDMAERYIWLVYDFFIKSINLLLFKKSYLERRLVLIDILQSEHFLNLLSDKTVLPKGVKRKVFDYLALNKRYGLLTLYCYLYDYK